MCGNAAERQAVDALTFGAKIDLFLTDPPYNVDYVGKTKDALRIQNDRMDKSGFKQLLIDSFGNADQVMKPGAAFYIWHSDREDLSFRYACEAVGWQVRECLIWNKNSLVLGRQDYQWKHEPCLYGWKNGAAHYFINNRTQTTVIDVKKPNRNKEHPTMKPIELFGRLINNSSQIGWNVLDLFGGSGTSLLCCEMSGRNCYTMELDPFYCEVIINRWENLTGGKAKLQVV